jgi:hypothetical protein
MDYLEGILVIGNTGKQRKQQVMKWDKITTRYKKNYISRNKPPK